VAGPTFQSLPLPPGTAEYLRFDNPRLIELRKEYQALQLPVTASSLWTDQFQHDAIYLPYFRGDNAFIWQYRGYKREDVVELTYLLTAYYVQKIDALNLLRVLREDDLFGIYTFNFNDEFKISRDLLDSIVEIYFLERHLELSTRSSFSMLDIGAGYGRLAYRMVNAFSNLGKYYCTDAIAISTFICEYYLRFREVDNRAIALPLHEVEKTLSENPVDIAVNIHSFSECTLEAIAWWLEILRKYKVKYLMVVPNDGPNLLSRENDETHLDFSPVIDIKGYRQVAKQPKFLDPSIQHLGVHPATYYLFELIGG
jgi:SAM-dependent methyltransferase